MKINAIIIFSTLLLNACSTTMLYAPIASTHMDSIDPDTKTVVENLIKDREISRSRLVVSIWSDYSAGKTTLEKQKAGLHTSANDIESELSTKQQYLSTLIQYLRNKKNHEANQLAKELGISRSRVNSADHIDPAIHLNLRGIKS